MTSLKFGTSGLRGLVVDLEGGPARRWTGAFLRHLAGDGTPARGEILVARDLRSSSPAIARDCLHAARSAGWRPVDCGPLPTPALALEAIRRGVPAIMVTGSHIPDDRNGLKFYRATGEIAKNDETGIRAALDAGGAEDDPGEEAYEDAGDDTLRRYADRYRAFFAPDALAGLRVGVFQHSSVARDLLVDLLRDLGAGTAALGRSPSFVPVDTEAHRPADVEAIAGWAEGGRFDAIVSTDGDADRPLVADQRGTILRGDIVGLLTARRLGCRRIVTPVTSGTAIERSGLADAVVRTRVGSPFVIAAMEATGSAGGLIGFEANGGVLLGSRVEENGRRLEPLATRDAVLPILAVLSSLRGEGMALSVLVDTLKPGHALADRLTDVGPDRSGPFLAMLEANGAEAARFFEPLSPVTRIDATDGVRATLGDGSTVHYRASGNAPELRCYVEAADAARASYLLSEGLALAAERVR